MKVFVSHKDVDMLLASRVASTLRESGHTVYLDGIDTNLQRDGDDLGAYLRQRLGECDSLIAVISASTKGSWWVPWEIGVATEKDYPLSTYLSDAAAPPEYLEKWPVLRSLSDLKQFARLVQLVASRATTLQRVQNKSFGEAKHLAVSEFHSELKKAIGQ